MSSGESVATAAAREITAVASEVRLQPAWLATLQPQLEVASSITAAAELLLGFLAAADLRNASAGSLPPDLSKQHDVRLSGSHLLQVIQVVDIAQPRVIDEAPEGEVPENGSTDPAARRGATLMKVVLSDGAQAICGIERKPIAVLRAAEPGTKVVLGGGPLVRRGFLLLEPRHMEALGGSVPRVINRSTGAVPIGQFSASAPRLSPTAPAPIQAAPAPALNSQGVRLPLPLVLRDIEDAPRPFSSEAPGVTLTLPFPSVIQVTEPAAGHLPVAPTVQSNEVTMMASSRGQIDVRVATPQVSVPQHLMRTPAIPQGHSQITSRFYVSDVEAAADGLWVRLCDGVGICEAAMSCEVLQSIFPEENPDRWLQRTRMLHGLFEISQDSQNAQGLRVHSFTKSPLIGEVEEQLRCLAGA